MVRTILGGIGVLVGLILAIMTLLPTEYIETTLQLNRYQTQTNSNEIANQAVHLRLPSGLSSGEPVLFEMTLLPAQGATQKSASAAILEGRLDLPGVETFPAPVSEAAYLSEQTISFRWLVTAGKDAPRQGRLWLTIVVPDSTGGETRSVLLAHPLEIGLRRVVGLSFSEARWIGGGIAVIGLAVILFRREVKNTPRQKRTKNIHSL
jgi:hypothetical protein